MLSRFVGGKAKSWIGSKISRNPQVASFVPRAAEIGKSIVESDSFRRGLSHLGGWVDRKIFNQKLKPVVEGMNIGEQFHKQMSGIFDYMKGVGEAPNDKEFYESKGANVWRPGSSS